MTESPRPDDRLLDAAAAIARGEPVDWAQLPVDTDSDSTTVVAQLRALEGVSQQSEPVPGAWGPFTILGEIGHGSFGTVYRAIDPNLNIEIALKVVRPHAPITDGDFTRALTEARILAQINHPHVVRVFQVQRIDQEVGLSMELVKGRTLHNIVKTDGPLSANESMLARHRSVPALAAVHGAQLLHGDIKAHNVMRAEGGRTVLMDFGAGDDLKTRPTAAGSPRRPGRRCISRPRCSTAASAPRLGHLQRRRAALSRGHSRLSRRGQHAEEVEQQHAARRRAGCSATSGRTCRTRSSPWSNARPRGVPRIAIKRAGELEAALRQALRGEEHVPAPAPPWFRRSVVLVAGVFAAVGLSYWLWTACCDLAAASAPPGDDTPTCRRRPSPTPYQIEAAFYREQGGEAVRLQAGARVAPGDRMSLRVLSSIPTYLYIVNEDDRGESYLLFPLPGQALSNPLPAGTASRDPGTHRRRAHHLACDECRRTRAFPGVRQPGAAAAHLRSPVRELAAPTIDRPAALHLLRSQERAARRGRARQGAGHAVLDGIDGAVPDAAPERRGNRTRRVGAAAHARKSRDDRARATTNSGDDTC